MKKVVTKIDEFVAAEPKPTTAPPVAPPKPGTRPSPPSVVPGTRPSVEPNPLAKGGETQAPVAPPKPGTRPSPPSVVPGTRPSVEPNPLAKDVIKRFMSELQKQDGTIELDLKKLKKIYG